jgi:O-antigen/teichoic acid export membrane protein
VHFGTYSLANTTAVTLSGIGALGFGDAMQKLLAESFRRDRDGAVRGAALAFWTPILFTAVLLAAAWASQETWTPRGLSGTGDAGQVLALCLLIALANLLVSLSLSVFAGVQDFRMVSLVTGVQAVVLFALAPTMGFAFGVHGALAAVLGGAVVCVAVSLAAIGRIDRRILSAPSLDLAQLRQIGKVAAPSWIASLVVNPVTVISWASLSAQPGGDHELGLFNAANALKMLVAVVPAMVGAAMTPVLMEEGGRHGSSVEYARLHADCFYALLLLALPATALAVGFSDLIFLVYGQNYAESAALFDLLAVGVCVSLVNSPIQVAYVARTRTWTLLMLTLVKMAFFLALVSWWVPEWRAGGLAWAWLAAEVAFAALAVVVATALRLVPARSLGHQVYFLAGMLAFLAVFSVTPTTSARFGSIALAVVSVIAIVRAHPATLVWIESSLPSVMRQPFRQAAGMLRRIDEP